MSDEIKYYYLKLKDNFYDRDEIKIIESLPNGYKYSNILLKLYLKSLKHKGKLMFNERIPYNHQLIATVTGHDIDTVRSALDLFKEFELIEILDNGAIYMLDIQDFIGKSSTEADRIRNYRNQIAEEKEKAHLENVTKDVQMYEKSTTKLPITRDRERTITKIIINSKEINNTPADKPAKYDEFNQYYQLSLHMLSYIKQLNPNFKEPNLQMWSDEFRKIIEIDKRDINIIGELIDKVFKDSFWQTNILSPSKLRKQYDQLYMKLFKIKKNQQPTTKDIKMDVDYSKFV